MALLPSDPAKQKLLIAALVPVLGAFAYWYFLHDAYAQENVDKARRLEALQARNDAARVQALRAGPELQQRVDRYRAHVDRLEQLIPRSEEVPQLLNDMTLRARETSVDLVLLQPESEVPGAFYDRQVYEVSVIGSYHDIGRFLAAIGSLDRIITATDFQIQVRGRNSRTGAVDAEATFRIETYVLPRSHAPEVTPDA